MKIILLTPKDYKISKYTCSAFTVNLCHHLHFSSSFPPLLHAPAYLPLPELVLPLPLTGLPLYEPVLPLHALPLQPLLQIASPPSPHHVLASASSSSSEDLLTASDCQHVAYRSKADIQTPCKLNLFHNCRDGFFLSTVPPVGANCSSSKSHIRDCNPGT